MGSESMELGTAYFPATSTTGSLYLNVMVSSGQGRHSAFLRAEPLSWISGERPSAPVTLERHVIAVGGTVFAVPPLARWLFEFRPASGACLNHAGTLPARPSRCGGESPRLPADTVAGRGRVGRLWSYGGPSFMPGIALVRTDTRRGRGLAAHVTAAVQGIWFGGGGERDHGRPGRLPGHGAFGEVAVARHHEVAARGLRELSAGVTAVGGVHRGSFPVWPEWRWCVPMPGPDDSIGHSAQR